MNKPSFVQNISELILDQDTKKTTPNTLHAKKRRINFHFCTKCKKIQFLRLLRVKNKTTHLKKYENTLKYN